MNRTELLAKCIEMLDEVNKSTKIALNILDHNAQVIGMIADEIINGAEEAPPFISRNLEDLADEHVMDDLNEIVENIVAQIKAQRANGADDNELHVIDLVIDPDAVDINVLMQLVQERLEEGIKLNDEEDFRDDINFDNPLK